MAAAVEQLKPSRISGRSAIWYNYSEALLYQHLYADPKTQQFPRDWNAQVNQRT